MKAILVLTIALFSCGLTTAQTQAEEPSPSPDQIRLAYRQVQMAPHFSMGGAGFTGAPSEAEKALRVLVRAKDARLLESLTRERNPAARIFALMGMRDTAYPKYKQFAVRLEQSDDTVMVLRGCLMAPEKMSVLARRFLGPELSVGTKPVTKPKPRTPDASHP
ncbi:MAG: hypothetical protein H8F28_22730 [Fibrella sp.]|nr:hypothetical protein [Armatimonadota bacterium]